MKILGIDFETQHDDAKTCPVTEIGAVLVEIDPNYLNPPVELGRYSQIVYHPGYPPQTPEIVELTGLTDDILKAEGIEPKKAFPPLFPLVEQADIILAHNKKFDQTVYESATKRMKLDAPNKPWICTLVDVPWPARLTCRKLSHLAYEHGILIDPRTLHRAAQDVELMLKLVLGHYKIQDVLAYAAEPWIYLRADIPKPFGPTGDGGVGKELAKKKRFGWEKAPGTDEPVFDKAWVKRVKKSQVEAEIKSAPFPIIVLGE